MTYTFKLARRLAVSRKFRMLAMLGLLAACTGETTAPEATDPAEVPTPVAFRIVPSAVTLETTQPVRFRGVSQTRRGETFSAHLSWEASGGSINHDGTFSSEIAGTYRVIGRRRGRTTPDTSIVTVVPPLKDVAAVVVTPQEATLAAGTGRTFYAAGRLLNRRLGRIGVTWTATGGSIDAGGVFTAGSAAGTFHVIATNRSGKLADTARVVVTPVDLPETPPPSDSAGVPGPDPEPTPEPDPPPPPPTPLASVILKPASVTLAPGLVKQFAAFGRNTAGDSVAVAVSFSATGGTITPTGLYTAGNSAGTYTVTATANGLSATAVVTVPRALGSGGASGTPFGSFNMFGENAYTRAPAISAFNLSLDPYSAETIVARIQAARARGLRLMLAMASGSHSRYKTDGVFDMAKWTARMDTYNTPAIKAAIAQGVADGTILGNEVMDEPQNRWGANSWGPEGTMTKARVDQMCAYVKNMFPTLPAGVTHDQNAFEPSKSYRVCDFIISQYRWSKTKGDVRAFRDAGLALARRDGHGIAFSLNILDGGLPAGQSNGCSSAMTGGVGTESTSCRMTADQVREWGKVLGSAGCALFMWRFDEAYMARQENLEAFGEVAGVLANVAAKPCRRS